MTANNATARLAVSYAGAGDIAQFDLKVTKQLAAAPAAGGGSGGGGSGSGTKSTSVPGNATTNSTSYGPISSATNPQITVASGEKLYASYSGTYTMFGGAAGSRAGTFVHEYSSDNFASFTAFGAAVTGSSSIRTSGAEPETYDGSVTINQNVTPGAGTYYVRTRWKLDAGSRTVTLNGESATYEAKA